LVKSRKGVLEIALVKGADLARPETFDVRHDLLQRVGVGAGGVCLDFAVDHQQVAGVSRIRIRQSGEGVEHVELTSARGGDQREIHGATAFEAAAFDDDTFD
jgi:hypothetical protein